MAPYPLVTVTGRGINLVTSDGGLAAFVGERVAHELSSAGEHVAEIRYPRLAAARTQVSAQLAERADNDVTVICLNPGQVADFDYDVGVLFRPGRLVIVAIVDSVWSPRALSIAAQIADEVWCWDAHTANRITRECQVHGEALPFPIRTSERERTDGGLVCWADLGEPGHFDAVVARASTYVHAERRTHGTLHAYVSDWRADLLAFETLSGLAGSPERLVLHRAASWREALERADTILPLGSGIGPVEAEALSAGVDLVGDSEPFPPLHAAAPRGTFRAAAVERLMVLRAGRSAVSQASGPGQ